MISYNCSAWINSKNYKIKANSIQGKLMQEFAFLCKDEIVLSDKIAVLNEKTNDKFLVANSKELDALIYAPEINFYLKNTTENTLTKAKNSLKLYEIRASEFDYALDVDFSKEIGKNILLVSNESENIEKSLKELGFNVIKITHAEVELIYGQIGDLCGILKVNNNNTKETSDFGDESVCCDFDILLVRGAKDFMLRQSGCFEIDGLNENEILNLVGRVSPKFDYKKVINYDDSICQYHRRRSEHCAKCVDICPSVAIMKDDEKRELVFSDIDCVSCGLCASVCPSGSIEWRMNPRQGFEFISKFYEDHIALILDESINLDDLSIKLKDKVLPLMLKTVNFLDQSYLLNLVQTTGATVILLTKNLGGGTKDSVDLINEIYEKAYGKKAILLADESDIEAVLELAEFIEGSKFDLLQTNLNKREIFAKRVKHLVGENDFGQTAPKEWVRYGKITINEDSCTLCLSCVGACNVGALYADKSDNSIKFNASVCTTCGYCETSCAEKDTLKVYRDGMELKNSYFEYKTLAKDELFKCVECKKEFATAKSVQKIANTLKPLFAGNPVKLRTLYCCAECKAKLMLKEQIEKGEFDE